MVGETSVEEVEKLQKHRTSINQQIKEHDCKTLRQLRSSIRLTIHALAVQIDPNIEVIALNIRFGYLIRRADEILKDEAAPPLGNFKTPELQTPVRSDLIERVARVSPRILALQALSYALVFSSIEKTHSLGSIPKELIALITSYLEVDNRKKEPSRLEPRSLESP